MPCTKEVFKKEQLNLISKNNVQISRKKKTENRGQKIARIHLVSYNRPSSIKLLKKIVVILLF